jgi:hypothetical protein
VRLVGGDFAAIEAGLLGTKQPQAAIPSEAERSTVEYKRPNARAPLISGDFAAIEAGLLGALREQATATVSETDISFHREGQAIVWPSSPRRLWRKMRR